MLGLHVDFDLATIIIFLSLLSDDFACSFVTQSLLLQVFALEVEETEGILLPRLGLDNESYTKRVRLESEKTCKATLDVSEDCLIEMDLLRHIVYIICFRCMLRHRRLPFLLVLHHLGSICALFSPIKAHQ